MVRDHSVYKFRDEWLVQDKYKDWVVEDGDPRFARCKFCMKSFNIANSGKYALNSHAKAESHARNAKSRMNSPFLAHLRKSMSGHVPASVSTMASELEVFGRYSNVNCE